MGDKYWKKHRKKKPKRTPKEIEEDRIKRKELKSSIID